MHRITRLQPDIVKFDGALMQRLMETAAGYGLLTAMVSTFSREGILTVFEGVENHEQVELAERSGVAMVQGFALARPELAPGRFAALSTPDPAGRRSGHAEPSGSDPGGRRQAHGQTHVFGKRERPS
jgi:EAL domain-containing protein (putative c-di-GMP-specific phosphodiesterase class I)